MLWWWEQLLLYTTGGIDCAANNSGLVSLSMQSLLGQVDLAFLAAYAVGMFFAGHLGDRTDLRIFLTVGMLGSGIFCSLFGLVSACASGTSTQAHTARHAHCSCAIRRVCLQEAPVLLKCMVWFKRALRCHLTACCEKSLCGSPCVVRLLCRHTFGTSTAWLSSGLSW
jgi:MFS family permease